MMQEESRIEVVKRAERDLIDLINAVAQDEGVNKQWLAIASTDLQKGMLCMLRAVAEADKRETGKE